MPQKEQNLSFPSEASPQRPLRDRVGIFIAATRAVDAINKIREAEQAGVQQVWGQSPGFADILSDGEIWAVIAFLKNGWPAQTRAQHDRLNLP